MGEGGIPAQQDAEECAQAVLNAVCVACEKASIPFPFEGEMTTR